MSIIITEIITNILAISAFGLQVLLVVIVALILAKSSLVKPLSTLAKNYGIWIILLFTLSAVAGSLFYSEYSGYIPCTLCWWQRILIYPQVLLIITALWKKHRKQIFDFILPLNILGLIVSAFQYMEQMISAYTSTSIDLVNCAVEGVAPSCSHYYFLKFGYITMPMMSLTLFACILIIICLAKRSSKNAS